MISGFFLAKYFFFFVESRLVGCYAETSTPQEKKIRSQGQIIILCVSAE